MIRGFDIDPILLGTARLAGDCCDCEVEVARGTTRNLNVPDNSVDMVSCHQLIHHITYQDDALQEFYRVLMPGDMLLLGESCRPFLQIYWVRWLFRHPDMEQKTATGYINLVRDVGFEFTESDLLETTPWWSRRDLGILKKLRLQFWSSKVAEIFIVATKPAQ